MRRAATIWGRLYYLPAEFPALEVPDSSILEHGTINPMVDTQTQNIFELHDNAITRSEGDWNLAYDELMIFANHGFDLSP